MVNPLYYHPTLWLKSHLPLSQVPVPVLVPSCLDVQGQEERDLAERKKELAWAKGYKLNDVNRYVFCTTSQRILIRPFEFFIQLPSRAMSYNNPLHPPVYASRHSTFNSLSASSSSSSSASNSRCRRVPYTPSAKFRSTSRPQASIAFDSKGHPGSGMPMREIHARGEIALAQMMDKGAETITVFSQCGLRRINLVVRVSYSSITSGYDSI